MSSRRRASIGVSNVPGAMVFTRIAQLARSRAATMVIAWTAPFDAEYEVCPICPSNAAAEAVSLGRFNWGIAQDGWQIAARELAAHLAAGWNRLEATD